MLNYPGLFSFGVFSKKGPSQSQLDESSFVSTFIGKGYKSLIPASSSSSIDNATLGRPDYEIIAKVHGPEMGYVATPICIEACARKIIEDRRKKTKRMIPSGVLTPASAFGSTDLIHYLNKNGVSFSVVSVRDI